MENFKRYCAWAQQNIHIAHHIPGRIRLKFNVTDDSDDWKGMDWQVLKKVFETMDGIKSLKINLLARSMRIEYDANTLSPESFADFLKGEKSSAALQFEANFQKHFQYFV